MSAFYKEIFYIHKVLCLLMFSQKEFKFRGLSNPKCKAKVNIKLSPKIRRLEIQDSCCSSAGCVSVSKHS